jgi:hypothetical protein
MSILWRARPAEWNKETSKALKEIEEACTRCAKCSHKPSRFKLSLRADDLVFSAKILSDITYLDENAASHVVDEATHYCTARFLKAVTAEEVSRIIRMSWIEVYTGPPYVIKIDPRTQFV